MSDIQVWTPKPFDGTDLMPVLRTEDVIGEVVSIDLDPEDIIIPAINLLQGSSELVKEGLDGASPGKFVHAGSGDILESPLRCLLIFYHRGNALFPNPNDPDHRGLERCISRDAITGDVYGSCAICGKCTEWRDPLPGSTKQQKPLGSRVHNLLVLTNLGPAYIRAMSTSFKPVTDFLQTVKFSHKNPWTHPLVVSTTKRTKEMGGGRSTSYFTLKLGWDRGETCPPDVDAVCRRHHEEFRMAFESGRLQSKDMGEA